MTVASPFFLWAAAAVAAATVAAHLLAWRRPPAWLLPTARFAPERPARIVSRAVRPTDVALLALRVTVVLLAGIALARPTVAREGRGQAHVVVVDRSRSAGDAMEVRDSARAVFRPGDALVVFDSLAREVPRATLDSIGVAGQPASSSSPGLLSPALIVALRAAERLTREHDSVEVVVVSALTADEIDAATGMIRSRWVGPVRVMRPRPVAADTVRPSRADVRADANDPVAAALALVGPVAGGAAVRLVRDGPTRTDSAWAEGGGVLVAWPAAPDSADWPRRPVRDTAFAVVADGGWARAGPRGGTAAVVAPFERRVMPPAGRVVARWGDGEPAATEASLGAGCVRGVAVAVSSVGDLALTPAFRHFARRMVAPCNDALPLERASDSVIARVLPAVAPVDDAASRVDRRATDGPSRAGAWLLAAALALAVAELFVRKGESHATA